MAAPNKKPKITGEDPHDTVARCVKDSAMLKLIVGPQRENIFIHKKLACHYSAYLRGVFDASASYRETELGEVVWDDEDVNVVKLFVTWLYSQRISLSDHGVNLDPEEEVEVVDDLPGVPTKGQSAPSEYSVEEGSTLSKNQWDETSATYHALFKLWIFADKRRIPNLGNMVITEIYNLHMGGEVIPDLPEIVLAWRACTPNSKLRSFIIDAMTLTYGWDYFNSQAYDLPTSFVTLLFRNISWEGAAANRC